MSNSEVVVLGAGPAGIAAAISLGDEAVLLEGRREIGGLAGSIEIDGAIFDFGGHSFHTPHPEVRDLVFNTLEMYEQKREARCFSHGSLISYPFQKHFRELNDSQVVEECQHGLTFAGNGDEPGNFEDYLQRRFGSGIAHHFLFPYNRKLWGTDLKRLSTDWVNQRVAAPEGVAQEFQVFGGQRKPLQSDTVVGYPARGGFGGITEGLLRNVKDLRLGSKVARVDPVHKKVITKNGEAIQWRHLISSIPIHELLNMIEGVPRSLMSDAASLEYLSLKLIFVVINHPVDTEIQRIYVADKHLPAHKIVINHNSSPYLRSLPHHAIMGEVSYSAEKPPVEDIGKCFLENLIDLKLIGDKKEVLKVVSMDVKYAYPLPTFDREGIVNRMKQWLEEREIFTVGRFGEWAYINSDEAMYRGLILGRTLGNGRL